MEQSGLLHFWPTRMVSNRKLNHREDQGDLEEEFQDHSWPLFSAKNIYIKNLILNCTILCIIICIYVHSQYYLHNYIMINHRYQICNNALVALTNFNHIKRYLNVLHHKQYVHIYFYQFRVLTYVCTM